MEVWHIDSSALTELVRPEPDTGRLVAWLRGRRWVISDLHRIELRWAAARAGGRAPARAERLLMHADIIRIDAEVFDRAGRLVPASLRSQDSLHLAAALLLGPDLAGIVAYDHRLLEAARTVGVTSIAP